MNGEESIKDLAAAMDETLNKIKTHFEATSSEILSKSTYNTLIFSGAAVGAYGKHGENCD
jgi:hypothetical protein